MAFRVTIDVNGYIVARLEVQRLTNKKGEKATQLYKGKMGSSYGFIQWERPIKVAVENNLVHQKPPLVFLRDLLNNLPLDRIEQEEEQKETIKFLQNEFEEYLKKKDS